MKQFTLRVSLPKWAKWYCYFIGFVFIMGGYLRLVSVEESLYCYSKWLERNITNLSTIKVQS